MPTYTVGTGKAYSTIEAAISAIPSNIAGTGVHDVVIDSGTYLTSFGGLLLSKSGGSASDYVHIRAATGSEHKGIYSAGVVVGRDANWGVVLFRCNAAYTRVSNIIFYSPTVSSDFATRGDVVSIGEQNCIFTNVIGIGGGTAYVFNASSANGSTTYFNCIAARNILALVAPAIGFYLFSGDKAYNCGAYDAFQGFKAASGVDGLVRNCWAYTNPADLSAVGFIKDTIGNSWLTSSNNASNDTTAPGSNSLANLSVASLGFTSPTTYNFHITSSSSLFSAGIDLSGIFTTDIDGDTFAPWSIGPDAPPVPPLYQPTGSNPAKVHQSKANVPKGSPGSNKSSGSVKEAHAPVLKKGGSGSSPGFNHNSSIPLKESGKSGLAKGFKSGYIAIVPERGGYLNGTLGTGHKVQFHKENLAVRARYDQDDMIGYGRTVKHRTKLPPRASGEVTFALRSNDAIPVFMSHFQKRYGSALAGGTTYYEFYPTKTPPTLIGSSFGTGTYGSGSSSAFTVSVFKAINGTGYHLQSGLCDTLEWMFTPSSEAEITAGMRFGTSALVGTSTMGSLGTYSTLPNFSGYNCDIYFGGLPLTNFSFKGDNKLLEVDSVSDEKCWYRFGKYQVTGKASVDVPKTALAYLGSMLSGGTFNVYGTLTNSNRDKIVFQMPNCRLDRFDFNLFSSTGEIPFKAYESEDGLTPPLKLIVWTQNYSATTFEPN